MLAWTAVQSRSSGKVENIFFTTILTTYLQHFNVLNDKFTHNPNFFFLLVHVPEPIFESTGFKKDFGSDSINFESRPPAKNRIKIMDFGENEFRFVCVDRTR